MSKRDGWRLPVIGGAALALCVGCSQFSNDTAHVPAGPRVYVSNETGGTVSVVDPIARRVTATIPVGKRPRGIRVSDDGRTVFVALSGSPMGGPGVDESKLPPPDRQHDGIGVIDVRTGRLTRVLQAGSDPEQFAIANDGRRMFVANEDAGQVSVLDIDTGTIVKTIPVGGEPEGVDLSADGRVVYVTAEADNQVFVIDTQSLGVIKVLEVGARPRSTGFVPNARLAFVAAENEPAVYAVETSTHTILKRIALDDTRLRPMGVLAARDGRLVYVTTGRGGTLLKIDTASHEVVGTLAVGERPWGAAVSPDGRTIVTANGPSNDISLVDTLTWTVTGRVKVGDRPWGAVFVR